MEIDDSGKERRNALVVSAAIASAAFLQLKMPSFLAEYIKFEVPTEQAYRVWIIAALAALYTLMRFHFSDGRTLASQAPRAAFAQQLDTALSARFGKRSSAGQAHNNWYDEVLVFAEKNNDGDYVDAIDRRHFEPYDHIVMTGGVFVHWRIRKAILDEHAPASDRYSAISSSVHAVGRLRRQIIRMQSIAARVFWSKAAWEINTVYVVSFAAIAASLVRAHVLF